MFNLKVMLLIGCLIAVSTAQSDPAEFTGKAKEKAVRSLKVTLKKVASEPNQPNYTFDDVDKVTKSNFNDTQLKYELKLKKDDQDAKDCIVYLTVTRIFNDLIVQCPGEKDYSRMVFFRDEPNEK